MTTRRHFLRRAAAAAPLMAANAPWGRGLAGLAALAGASGAAQAAVSDHKALVCVFLQGGNDSHNWLVPTEAGEYATYANVRQDLALAPADLLPLGGGGQAAGRSFGLASALEPLRRWYDAGQAAFVANVGPLERPLTLVDWHNRVGLPRKLFSHNDQQSTWQSLSPEGARSGWGGRMADAFVAANAQPVLSTMSTAGQAVFLTGNATAPFQVNVDGPVAVSALSASTVLGSAVAANVLQRRIHAGTSPDPLAQIHAGVLQRSVDYTQMLQSALSTTSIPGLPSLVVPQGGSTTTLDQVSLAQQLRMVARLIQAGPTLGLHRQIFMVQMSGFDTHANHARDHRALSAQVATALDWFLGTMQSAGLLDNVVLFTASDFGRALVSNGDGCDHGWGGHHLVAGGGVRGGRIVGQFPDLSLGGPSDVGSGRLLPSTSVTQLAAALGGWMGLSSSQLQQVLPNLGAFTPLTGLF